MFSFRDSMAGFSYEKRPLKRQRLGPPDVYPQDPRQREDELTALNVKQGFSHIPQISDEFGTAKNLNISAAKLGAFINGTIAKKNELNAIPDSGKRRPQVNTKDNFWPVTPRSKQAVESFMKDLKESKPLTALAKKVPIFNKREEIFITLAEHNVPLLRAAWFLKMTASYNSAISEAKTKKRQMPDPTEEWTKSLLRCLKDLLNRLTNWYNAEDGASIYPNGSVGFGPGPPPTSHPSSTPTHLGADPGPTELPEDGTQSLNRWRYITDFAKHLYEEGLLDRFEWLSWVVEACERTISLEDGGWKALTPLLLSFIPHISQSELLSRRLAHTAARRLSSLFSELENNNGNNLPLLPPPTLLNHLNCHSHKSTVLTLVTALQVIVVECPTALVFNGNGGSSGGGVEGSRAFLPPGSPLDILPIPPSALPMPPRANNQVIRVQIRTIEEQIRGRSRGVEAKWACEEWQESTAAPTLQKVLLALEALDSHSFEKVEPTNSLETLYNKIFSTIPINKDNPCESDAPIILLLCQWATGPFRHGDHRGIVVAKLLEHRQAVVTSPIVPDSDSPSSAPPENGASNPSSNPPPPNNTTPSNNNVGSSSTNNTSSRDNNNVGGGNTSSRDANGSGGEEVGERSGENSSEGESGGGEGGGGECKMTDFGNCGEEGEGYSGMPIYHNLLFNYLDTEAPVLDDSSEGCRAKFSALVHLFSCLIRHDIFSHDSYLCSLVARGDLSASPPPHPHPSSSSGGGGQGGGGNMGGNSSVATPGGPGSLPPPTTPASVSSAVTPGTTPHHETMGLGGGDEGGGLRGSGGLFQPLPRLQETSRQADYDDRNIDDDLDRILQHITQEQQNNMDQVDSPKDESGSSGGGGGGFSSLHSSHHPPPPPPNPQSEVGGGNGGSGGGGSGGGGGTPRGGALQVGGSSSGGGGGGEGGSCRQSRHRLYVTHFPLPQDEAYTHEVNQRHILLYGVGRARDEAKHGVKKILKDLGKIFTKRFCFDISDGSRIKKSYKSEISLEGIQARFMGLPYFDQHAVTSVTATTLIEMLASFGAGRASYLPTVEHVAFLTELMEVGLNIVGLVETSILILRELPNIEDQLLLRGSSIQCFYTTSLLLQVVAILRRYHNCLLLDPELVVEAWDGLTRSLRRFNNPTDCTSAERCTLAYLTDLHASCAFLRSKNFNDVLTPVASKLRTALCAPVTSTLEPTHGFNNAFMMQCLDNPKRKVEPSLIRQLNENPSCRYSFVCNAVLSICNEAEAEVLNDLVSLCAEMTAACPSLAPEWLAVLQSLCSPSRHIAAYRDVLADIDVKHLSIHSSLATLTAMLVARQCFKLQEIVVQAVPLLLKAWNESNGTRDTDVEAGARLTCSLLLSLFKTEEVMNPSLQPSLLKLSSDRRLLSAAHSSITLGAVLAALKAMLLLADAAVANERRREARPGLGGGRDELSISHILGTSDVLPATERVDVIRAENRTLASFALSALQQMCAEPWVRKRCFHNPAELYQEDMLLDPILSPRQAQRLLHMICYPDIPLPEDSLDPKIQIPRIMERLDQWNLREACVALWLQNRQLSNNSSDYQAWLDTVAKSALEVFHLSEEAGQEYVVGGSGMCSPAPGKSPRSGKKGSQETIVKTPPSVSSSVSGRSGSSTSSSTQGERFERREGRGMSVASAWLVPPLVEKLSPQVQGKVLKHAGTVLESTLWPKTAPKRLSGSGLSSHLPFLALILTCLRGQDEQRETLLQSLLTQFTQLLQFSKEPDAEKKSEILRDALRLRLSLVGGMFDSVQRSIQATGEWAVVLTQLVTHSVVDLNTNSDVFFTVVDMITALVHSTQVTEAGERVEEIRKQNLNLIKKLKKELTDRDSESVKPLRQLLPFSKVQAEIIVTQSTSTIIDSKGNRVQSFEYVDKKPGLQVWEKQKVSPWELIEGQRNPAPLSWAWFGSVKMERKPLRYEDAHRLNKFHTHNFTKSFSHFLEPVPLPPEEVDSKPEMIHIVKEEILPFKPDTPLSSLPSEQSPRGPIPKVPKAKVPRKKRLTKAQQQQQQQQAAAAQAQAAAAAAAQAQQPPIVPQPPPSGMGAPAGVPSGGGAYGGNVMQGGGGTTGPPPSYNSGQWYGSGQGGQGVGQPPQQPPYYPPQQAQGPGGPGPRGQSPKVALHNLIRARTVPPGGQFQQFPQGGGGGVGVGGGGPGPPGPPPQPRLQILRQQLRAQPPQPNPAQLNQIQGGGFQAGQQNPPVMFQQQQQQQATQMQQGVNQNYNYNQGGMSGQNVGGQPGQANMGPRGPGQDLNFIQGASQPHLRQMGPRGNVNFMQGGPQVQGGQIPNYGRPQMTQMGQPGGIPPGGAMGQGQMVQAGMITNQMPQGQGQQQQGPQQRMMARQMMMQQQQLQQQQQQQQQMGMRGPGPQMHYNTNQPGGGY